MHENVSNDVPYFAKGNDSDDLDSTIKDNEPQIDIFVD